MVDVETVLDEILRYRKVTSVYQPIFRLDGEDVFGHEALARFPGVDFQSTVEPIFAYAERCGRGPELDWICRRAAIQGITEYCEAKPLFVNIGVAPLIHHNHDVDQTIMLLDWVGHKPHDVVLEITEREAAPDIGWFTTVLATYRQHGFRFALDDMGDGLATFAMLVAAEPEFIKLSESLLRTAAVKGSRSLVAGILAFAKECNSVVIAEGIEVATDLELAKSLGIPLGQGYHLARPTAASALGLTPK